MVSVKLITCDQASFLPAPLKTNLNFQKQIVNVNRSKLEQSLPHFQKPICHSLYSVITQPRVTFHYISAKQAIKSLRGLFEITWFKNHYSFVRLTLLKE